VAQLEELAAEGGDSCVCSDGHGWDGRWEMGGREKEERRVKKAEVEVGSRADLVGGSVPHEGKYRSQLVCQELLVWVVGCVRL
jgi:hypothetical protein